MAVRGRKPFEDPTTGFRNKCNPYVELMQESTRTQELPILYGPYLREVRGRWSEIFSQRMAAPPSRLILEVGCHFGKSLANAAMDHGDTGFIGADITFKRVVKTAQKAGKHGLDNFYSIMLYAQFCEEVFAQAELDGVLIFFPDPWTKQRQAKHRLINAEFVATLSRVIKPGGFFWFKTDQKPYFDEVQAFLSDSHSFTEQLPYVSPLGANYASTFEGHFTKQALPTYASHWRRQPW